MAATHSSVGNIRVPIRAGWPTSADRVLTNKTISTMTTIQRMPKTVNAQKLRTHATKLKKRLLKTGKSCQNTSAGACHTVSDNGKCKPMKTQAAY